MKSELASRFSDVLRLKLLIGFHDPNLTVSLRQEVVATLLDDERYLCSERTMYRVHGMESALSMLRADAINCEHPQYTNCRELVALRGPIECWSWDYSNEAGIGAEDRGRPTTTSTSCSSIFSRYVGGFVMVADRENSALFWSPDVNKPATSKGS